MRSQLKKWASVIAAAAPFLVATSTSVKAADWAPPGPIKLMIAFAAGGGADTQALLIAEEIEASTGWKFIPENVTGKGGVNLLNAMTVSYTHLRAPRDGLLSRMPSSA